MKNVRKSRRLVVEMLERRDVPSVAAPQAFPAGNSPSDVVNADFNGDGLYDVAVTNEGTPGTVSVMLNIGDGTFGAPKSFLTGGSNPTSLAVVDVSGDGRLDLVVTNNNSGSNDTVAVLRGSGTGLFRRPLTYVAGINPTSITYSEFTGDGVIDIVVVNEETGNVTVLIGLGAGAFQKTVSYDVGTKIDAVSTGDFNSDGLSDLVAVGNHTNAPKTAILFGNGNGTFSFGPQYDDGVPIDVSVADYNEDSKLDLAVASADNKVFVHLGIGDGTFQLANVYQIKDGLTLVQADDIDGDGTLDFVAVGPEQFVVYLGNGDGSFRYAGSYAGGANASGVALHDYTGDGEVDVAIANNITGGGTVTLQGGRGAGVFTALSISNAPQKTWDTAVADLNGDGELDVILSEGNNGGPGYMTVMLGVGNAAFEKSRSYLVGNGLRGFTAGDFNGDGALDVAVGLWSTEQVRVALGHGDGTFGPFSTYNASNSATIFDIAGDDIDDDGDIDLVVVDDQLDRVELLLGNGDGSFGANVAFPTGDEPRSVVIGDFNNDGKQDLATANRIAGTISILLGNGNGTFQPAFGTPAGTFLYDLVAEDFDGDGDLDLAVTRDLNAGTVGVLSGNGDGSFSFPNTYAVGNTPRTITAGDANGDGHVDLIVGNQWGGTVSLLLGKGDVAFEKDRQFAVGNFPYPKSGFVQAPVALADIDQNGWLDVVVAREKSLAVLLNDGVWPLPIPHGERRMEALSIVPNAHEFAAITPERNKAKVNALDHSETQLADGKSETKPIVRIRLREAINREREVINRSAPSGKLADDMIMNWNI